MHYSSRKQKGSVLVFSLLVLTILLASALAVMSVAVVEQQSSFATQRSVIAFQAADSGTERVLERIYQYASPTIAVWPIGDAFVDGGIYDWDLDELATQLSDAQTKTCSSGVVSAKNSSAPDYLFQVTFLDEDDNAIDCNDLGWRDKVVKIRSQGVYRNTSRFIEMGVRPRE